MICSVYVRTVTDLYIDSCERKPTPSPNRMGEDTSSFSLGSHTAANAASEIRIGRRAMSSAKARDSAST